MSGLDRDPYDVVVGDSVWWYPSASRSQEARLALVVGVDDVADGLVSLAVIERNSQVLKARYGVRHVDSDYNRTHLAVAGEKGGWDYGSSRVNREAFKATQRDLAALHAEVRALHANGHSDSGARFKKKLSQAKDTAET